MDYRLIIGLIGAISFAWGAAEGLRRKKFTVGGRLGRHDVVTRSRRPLYFWSIAAMMSLLSLASALWAILPHLR